MANVKEIEWQGGIYNIADETARGAAQNALSAAQTAQATGTAAQTAANAAQTAANTAQASANAAQTAADAAQSTANNVSAQFTNYKKKESVSVSLDIPGYALFYKCGNVCEISIAAPNAPAGTYYVTIPEGFVPVRGTDVGGLPLTWGEKGYGYWIIEGNVISLHVVESHSINATHAFLM